MWRQISGYEVISIYKSVCEASRRTGIGRGVISHCVNGRVNTAGGFLWEKIKSVTTISEMRVRRMMSCRWKRKNRSRGRYSLFEQKCSVKR